jgi:polyhydroxyalkanoate synthase
MATMPTARDTLHREGTAQLYRFRPTKARAEAGPAVLLVPSLINRWYVLDLRPGATLAGALADAGLDVYCLDWGVPNDEDRYLDWDALVARLSRTIRRVKRISRQKEIGLLGYCMGGTLAAIQTALEPEGIAALTNLAGPVDFSEAGMLATMTDARWFDPSAIAEAGNVAPWQMQSGFVALRPTAQMAKWIGFFDRLTDPERMEALMALEEWASANIPFPAAAYVKYIADLYQQNALVKGTHHVGGRRVDLSRIECPVLTVVTDRDVICPPAAATGLNRYTKSRDESVLSIPGGHVGAVVGASAPKLLYPKLAQWFLTQLSR